MITSDAADSFALAVNRLLTSMPEKSTLAASQPMGTRSKFTADTVQKSAIRGDALPNFGIARRNGAYYFSPMSTISLKLPERLLERLEAESRARGTTKSSVVRQCLEKELGNRPVGDPATCYDLASDLVGSLKGLPRDLATNPKYLEGFGK